MKKIKENKPKVTVDKEFTIKAQIGTQYVSMMFNTEGICIDLTTNLPHKKNIKQFRLSLQLISTILDRYEKES